MSMTGCQRRTLSHEFEFCTECSCSHTLQTFEPVRFIPRFYCIYLLHAEGEIVDFGEKIKKHDAKKVCSVCLDSESAMDDWVLGTCLFLWDTIELNEKRIYTLFSLVFREFQSSCRDCYQYKLYENIWMTTENLFTISSTLLFSEDCHQF